MSSQDTMNYAQSEEESAKIIQDEITKRQATIAELQKDMNNENQMINGLESKRKQHINDAARLHQQAEQERKQEEEERRREAEKNNDGFVEKTAKDAARAGLFF
jgi:membrane protein involved in colicin uptake